MWFVIDLKNLGEVSFRGILPFKNFLGEKKKWQMQLNIPYQNLRKKPSETSFAQKSWFLVKIYIKANSCRITLFEQFWIFKWRNKPQIQNVHEKLSNTGPF